MLGLLAGLPRLLGWLGLALLALRARWLALLAMRACLPGLLAWPVLALRVCLLISRAC